MVEQSNTQQVISQYDQFHVKIQEADYEGKGLQTGLIGDLIEEGFYDKLVIIGFPYDQGAKQSGSRGGADYGPDSFRRFVKDIGSISNPEYNIDISKGIPKISDYGNIQIQFNNAQSITDDIKLNLLHQKLSIKVGLCIKRQNFPFIIGGSREIFGAISDALLQQDINKQENRADQQVIEGNGNAFISISHIIDLQQTKQNTQGIIIPHQNSNKRYLLDKFQPNRGDFLIEFGTNGLNILQQHVEYFNTKNPNGKIYWMQDIRKVERPKQYESKQYMPLTQAGILFEQILLNDIERNTNIKQAYISLNIECVEGAIGVTSNCIVGTLKTEEAVEICYLTGLLGNKVVAFDISEYNPFVEDWRTGRLVASLFYYLTMGMSQRLQNLKLQEYDSLQKQDSKQDIQSSAKVDFILD